MASLDGNDGSEQDRDHRERYNMAGYLWAPDSAHLLFDANGRLWLYDLRNGTGVADRLYGSRFRRRSQVLARRRVRLLHPRSRAFRHPSSRTPACPLSQSRPRPIRANGKEQSILNGEVDWVYEEELDMRSNYFWSPDSKNIAYLQMNETAVPQYPLTDWIPTHAQVELQRYPQPGDANPQVRVGVVSAHGGKTAWIGIPIKEGDYIPRFGWVDQQNRMDRNRQPRSQAPRAVFCRRRQWGRAEDARDRRREVRRRGLRRHRGRWSYCSHQLERWAHAYLSLQLQDGETACGGCQTGGSTHPRRIRGEQRLQRRHRAQGRYLRIERRQSAGAAGVGGDLRRRAQAVELGRRISRRQLRARRQNLCRHVLDAHHRAGGSALPCAGGSCFGPELPRVLGDARARCLPCAARPSSSR